MTGTPSTAELDVLELAVAWGPWGDTPARPTVPEFMLELRTSR